MESSRREVVRSWWYKGIRSINYAAFRNWWAFLIFFGIVFLFCGLCLLSHCCSDNKDSEQLYLKKIAALDSSLNACCDCDNSHSNHPILDDTVDDRTGHLRDSFGGRTGKVTVTLAWNTLDDLDLQLVEPSGKIIYYGNKRTSAGGILDIDMNAGNNFTSNPIENIYYSGEPPTGRYRVFVNLYKRNTTASNIPYSIQVLINNQTFVFNKTISTVGRVMSVHEFNYP